jgi:hypothetical protein
MDSALNSSSTQAHFQIAAEPITVEITIHTSAFQSATRDLKMSMLCLSSSIQIW